MNEPSTFAAVAYTVYPRVAPALYSIVIEKRVMKGMEDAQSPMTLPDVPVDRSAERVHLTLSGSPEACLCFSTLTTTNPFKFFILPLLPSFLSSFFAPLPIHAPRH
jgi:hypothetical protein